MSFVDPSAVAALELELGELRRRATPAAIAAAAAALRAPPQPQPASAAASVSSPSSSTTPSAAAELEFARLAALGGDGAARAEAEATLQRMLARGERPSESAFWLAVARIEAGHLAKARETLAQLVKADPANERAAALLELFKQRVRREGRTGLALMAAGALVAVGAVALIAVLWARRRAGGSGLSAGAARGTSLSGGLGSAGGAAPPWRGSSGSSSGGSGSGSGGAVAGTGRYGSR